MRIKHQLILGHIFLEFIRRRNILVFNDHLYRTSFLPLFRSLATLIILFDLDFNLGVQVLFLLYLSLNYFRHQLLLYRCALV